jgi:threonine dehydratase
MPTLADIQAARERVRDEIVLTPCTRSLVFDDLVAADLWFKFENLHRTGSFKERGALNRLLHLDEEERRRGVITASAGNHAQAVAFHAGRLGVPATVVMPETTPLVKVQNTRRHGAEVILHGQRFSEAIEESKRLQVERGLVMIHAYDDDLVIAGQGTLGLELTSRSPTWTWSWCPSGGGGIIGDGPRAAVPQALGTLRRGGGGGGALGLPLAQAGRIVEVETSETLADGIAVKRVGDRTFPIIEEHVERHRGGGRGGDRPGHPPPPRAGEDGGGGGRGVAPGRAPFGEGEGAPRTRRWSRSSAGGTST